MIFTKEEIQKMSFDEIKKNMLSDENFKHCYLKLRNFETYEINELLYLDINILYFLNYFNIYDYLIKTKNMSLFKNCLKSNIIQDINVITNFLNYDNNLYCFFIETSNDYNLKSCFFVNNFYSLLYSISDKLRHISNEIIPNWFFELTIENNIFDIRFFNYNLTYNQKFTLINNPSFFSLLTYTNYEIKYFLNCIGKKEIKKFLLMYLKKDTYMFVFLPYNYKTIKIEKIIYKNTPIYISYKETKKPKIKYIMKIFD